MNYTWEYKRTKQRCESPLWAYWEADYDSISDKYMPEEINAKNLFNEWSETVSKKYPNGLIPIYWMVQGNMKDEYYPFQYGKDNTSWYNSYTHPVDDRGNSLNWLKLKVVDKFWNGIKADKGGFIQEYTGWKPAILQPYVYLESLKKSMFYKN